MTTFFRRILLALPITVCVTNAGEIICLDYCGPVCEHETIIEVTSVKQAERLGIEVYDWRDGNVCKGYGLSFKNKVGEHEVVYGEMSINDDSEVIFKSYLDIDDEDEDSVNVFCMSPKLFEKSSVFIQYGDSNYFWSKCGTKVLFNLKGIYRGS